MYAGGTVYNQEMSPSRDEPIQEMSSDSNQALAMSTLSLEMSPRDEP